MKKKLDSYHLMSKEKPRTTFERSVYAFFFYFIGFTGIFISACILYLLISPAFFDCKNEQDSGSASPVCTGVPDSNKFDCHPEDGLTEERCLQRGCCYHPTGQTLPPLNVPYCFYPSNYSGYSVYYMWQNRRVLTAGLKRNTPSGFPNDVPEIRLVITHIDDYTLRIKITDENTERFEVPIPINDAYGKLENPTYFADFHFKSPVVNVTRKSTGAVIFCADLSKLVYSDQFLQLSSTLPSSYLYGIGEHYGSFLKNVNWTRLTLLNSDRAPVPNEPLYGSHPFYLSMEEDGNANGVFLLNSNIMDVILQPTPAITYRPIGGILDFFILLGPSPANVVQQYTNIVGRTFMPPYWSLGFHLCRFGYDSLNTTKETLQRNIDAGINIDVQWNDIDYMERYKDFTYDKDKFANLPEFVDNLHQNGMHYILMTDPGISNSEKPGSYPPYDEGVADDIFIKNPNGSIFVGKVWTDGETVYPDFSNPKTGSYWTRQFTNLYSKVKYDGVWIDMNEPSNFYNGGKNGCMKSSFEDPVYLPGGSQLLRQKTVCMTAKHYKTIHYNEHNLYAYREANATNEALKTIRQKRPFIISRASSPGQGIKSGHWSGDIFSTWEDMRYTIPSMLNFNLFGISMIGSDICGFNSNTTVPLCARWQSLGAFYPFSRNHNDRSTIEQDPAALGSLVVAATVKSLHIRYWLLPYLYTLFYRSHAFGETVIRPLFFEYPQDKNTYSIDEQFLWGPGLMVIPALYPDIENVTAYFPKGKWYDGAGHPFTSNGQKLNVPVAMTDIFIALRGGTIFPSQIDGNTTTASRKNPFILIAALDENEKAIGELYWDDGDSLDTYENGTYTLIQFSIEKNELKSNLTRSEYTGSMDLGSIQISGISKVPTNVTVNGLNCPQHFAPNGKMNLFGVYDMGNNTADAMCVFQIFENMGLAIGTNGISLLSPLTVTWS